MAKHILTEAELIAACVRADRGEPEPYDLPPPQPEPQCKCPHCGKPVMVQLEYMTDGYTSSVRVAKLVKGDEISEKANETGLK